MKRTRSNWDGHRLTQSEHWTMRLLVKAGELRRRHGTAAWYAPGYKPRYATQTGVMRRLAERGLLVIVGDAAVLPPEPEQAT